MVTRHPPSGTRAPGRRGPAGSTRARAGGGGGRRSDDTGSTPTAKTSGPGAARASSPCAAYSSPRRTGSSSSSTSRRSRATRRGGATRPTPATTRSSRSTRRSRSTGSASSPTRPSCRPGGSRSRARGRTGRTRASDTFWAPDPPPVAMAPDQLSGLYRDLDDGGTPASGGDLPGVLRDAAGGRAGVVRDADLDPAARAELRDGVERRGAGQVVPGHQPSLPGGSAANIGPPTISATVRPEPGSSTWASIASSSDRTPPATASSSPLT